MVKTVIILGAGASIPFFCPAITTAGLTELVQNEKKWKKLLERYNTEMHNANPDLVCTVKWEPILRFIQRAHEVKENFNFEDLIGFIDMYSSYVLDDNCLGRIKVGRESKRQHDLLRFFNVRQPFQCGQYWPMAPFLVRQLIAEEIEERDRQYRSKDYCDHLNKQAGLLSGQLKDRDLSVYTFNYDDVLPQTLDVVTIPLKTGFSFGYFCSEEFLKATSILAFLHGHARWVLEDSGIREYPSMSDANTWRLRRLFSAESTSMEYVNESGAYDFNSFLTTGLDKDPSFNRNPYCAYHQRLACDLMSADALIVAGYSFRDPHIDRLLLNFLCCDSKKVMLISQLDHNIDIIHEFKNPDGFLGRALRVFGVTGIPANPANLRYKYDEELSRTNANGFGFLFPQIWIYKNGYGEFLSEWQTVLDEWGCSDDP